MARDIRLTRGYVTQVDDEDYTWARHHLWSASGSSEKGIYAVATIDGAITRLHRMIMDAPHGMVVDHINGDTLDNRRANLRVCTHRENLLNQRRRARPGYKGIYQRGDKWQFKIKVNGKYHCGLYDNPIIAAREYDRAAVKAHGEFAALNFSPDRDWLFPHEQAGEWPLADRVSRQIDRLRGR